MRRGFRRQRKPWRKIIEKLEAQSQGLADTLAINADPELQRLISEGENDIRTGKLIRLKEA